MPLLAERSVLSHASSVLWRGLPLVRGFPSQVHVLRRDGDGGFRRGQIHCHVGEVGDDEIEIVDGVKVTNVARTVVDCARTLSREAAVVLADAALERKLVTVGALDDQLVRAARRVGIRQARWVVAFADARSESPGESISRLRIHQFRLPTPDLQVKVRNEKGLLVARCDFGWEDAGTVGEFDGRSKYGRHLRPGESAADAVYREKRREDRIRGCRKEVVRWAWPDCESFGLIADQLRRAFERGSRT